VQHKCCECVERLNAQIDTVGSDSDPMMIELRRLKAENENLKANQELWGSIELITAQRNEVKQLRKTLEDVRLFSVSHSLYAIIDLCDYVLKDKPK